MGHVRPVQPRRSARRVRQAPAGLRADLAAVSPVIGSVLILVITVLGIAGVLYWGAPMIERIQVQNAQAAMVGEFEDIRDSSRELSVPDHSRFPTVVIPRGQVTLTSGSRVMVTADQDAGHTSCDFHVTNWAGTLAKTSVDVAANNCYTPKVAAGCTSDATTACLEIYQVSGATLSKQTLANCNPCTTVTIAGVDFSTGDWTFRLTNGAATPTIYAQAWIFSGDDVGWSSDSTTGKRSVTFDTGAIFSNTQGTNFLERAPTIGDTAFGAAYYGLWVRSLTAQSYGSITGAGAHQVYLSLIGNYDRVDSSTVYRIRYDVSGALAQSWCNSLVNRNGGLSGASYASQVASCGALPGADDAGSRSVCYTRLALASNLCGTAGSATGSAFTLRLLHARIYTSLAV